MSDDVSPQLENGYTRLANELLDALISAGLTARQWAVVMAIVRKTYGYNKSRDDIGLTQLSLMTGIEKSNLSRTIRELETMNVVVREVGVHSHNLGINKRHKGWRLSNQQLQLSNQQQLSNRQELSNQQQLLIQQPGVVETATVGVVDLAIDGLSNRQPQKTTIKDKVKTTPKDNLSDSLRESFTRFYAVYPKKRKKALALKAFAKLNPDESLLQTMLDAVEVAKRSRDDWRKEGGQYIPYPASWLNGRMWEDEPDQTEYAESERAVMEAYNAIMPADWARAVTSPFSPARASAVREFLSFSNKPDMARHYFDYCASHLAAHEQCGFDWLIKRDTYVKVREGVIKTREAA